MKTKPSVLVCRVGRLYWYHSTHDEGAFPAGGGAFNDGDERGTFFTVSPGEHRSRLRIHVSSTTRPATSSGLVI